MSFVVKILLLFFLRKKEFILILNKLVVKFLCKRSSNNYLYMNVVDNNLYLIKFKCLISCF